MFYRIEFAALLNAAGADAACVCFVVRLPGGKPRGGGAARCGDEWPERRLKRDYLFYRLAAVPGRLVGDARATVYFHQQS